LRSRLLAVVALLVVWSSSVHAIADTRTDLEVGRNLFGGGQYERAVEVLARVVSEPVDPKAPDAKRRRELQEAARPLYAASLLALGRTGEADANILAQLREDPFFELPVGQFPEPVVQRFATIARANAAELDALRQQVLKERQERVDREQREQENERRRREAKAPLAVEETVVTRRSRLLAFAPLGGGQFQNGSAGLGAFFAASELAGIVASITTHLTAQHYAAANCSIDDCDAARSGFEAARTANWISVGLTSALVVAGVVEANVAFIPEDRSTKRKATTSAVWAPFVAPRDSGVMVGAGLSF
jgi:hypothetical protein